MSDLNSFARSRVGTTLRGKYRLEALLGVGGMAAVYEATHRVGNRVAVKVLHPHLSINAELRTRFLREGYVANKVEHPGAVRVLDDDIAEDGSVFLAMELLTGETLEARRERLGGRLPAREVVGLAHELLAVLEAAHSKGIVHRDIKPENIFRNDEGVLKVLDFGIARLREGPAMEGLTKTGRMMGTPAFMPPEQALGRSRDIDGQTDLWAVGATMFSLVSGRYVHEAETAEEMLIRAGSQRARSVALVAPEVPPTIAAVIDRALAFDRDQRWTTARAMDEALENAYRGIYGAALSAVRGSSPPGVNSAAPEKAAAVASEGQGASRGQSSRVPRMVSTTMGIFNEPRPAEVPSGLRKLLGVGLGLAVAAVAATLIAMTQGKSKETPSGATSTAAAAQSVAAASAAPPPTPAQQAVVSDVAPLTPPPSPVATAKANPSETPRAVLTPRPATPSATPAPSPATASASAKRDCDPPYVIDAARHRQYKPECLK